MDRNLIFQHILTNIYWKNTFKISLPYLENELRHLCPLNPIQTPVVFFDGLKNELRHLCPLNPIQTPETFFGEFKNELRHLLRSLNRIQTFQNFSATP